MLRIINHSIKVAQSFLDDLGNVDWEDDQFESPWDKYLVDEIENPEEFTDDAKENLEETPEIVPETVPETGTQILPDGESIDIEKEYMSVDELLKNSMGEPPHIIKFDYTTRNGRFTGERIVEPHRIYTAFTTGNEILLTFDRTVNDIRGFIVGNIKPFGVMYRNTFQRRPEIMTQRKNKIRRPVSKG